MSTVGCSLTSIWFRSSSSKQREQRTWSSGISLRKQFRQRVSWGYFLVIFDLLVEVNQKILLGGKGLIEDYIKIEVITDFWIWFDLKTGTGMIQKMLQFGQVFLIDLL